MSNVRVLLISTYEMGRQPFGLASPAAWLREAGLEVECVDLTRGKLDDRQIEAAGLIGFYLPMHTATRLALPVIRRVRRVNARAVVCCFGLYAPLNQELLRSLGVTFILGGEFEAGLLDVVRNDFTTDVAGVQTGSRAHAVPRLSFRVPDRTDLPPLSRYATLQLSDGERRIVGYTEASRGCKHLCRHCPVVPIYNGQFRVVPREVVLEDVHRQIAAGAGHITFGDPDFFNGPRHALDVVTALHGEFPSVTYDVTIKIQHLLEHRRSLQALAGTGCLFVTSAVESLDDEVLELLQKQHTRRDFAEAVQLCREAGLTLSPTFVAFHPWLTVEQYLELLDTIRELDLVENVAPIQLGIRLLVPNGSRLLDVDSVRRRLQPFDPVTLTYPWTHSDRAVDELHDAVLDLIGRGGNMRRAELFEAIDALACQRAGRPAHSMSALPSRATVPYLNEPWYC